MGTVSIRRFGGMHRSLLLGLAFFIALLSFPPGVLASDFDDALAGIGSKNRKQIKASVQALAELGDPRALPVLTALLGKRLRIDDAGQFYETVEGGDELRRLPGGEGVDPAPSSLRKPRINNAVRRVLGPAIAQLQLSSDDPGLRRAAAESLPDRLGERELLAVRRAAAREASPEIREILALALARADIHSDDPERQIAAVDLLGRSGGRVAASNLRDLLASGEGEGAPLNPVLRKAAESALGRIEMRNDHYSKEYSFPFGCALQKP